MKASKFLKARIVSTLLLTALMALAIAGPAAAAQPVPDYDYAGPVFDVSVAPDGSVLVADAGSGVVELRKGEGSLFAELPGVAGVDPVGRGVMFAVTGAGDWTLYRITQAGTEAVANLYDFEAAVNPHPRDVDSNPFDVAALGGDSALVADAGGNTLLHIDDVGNVDWVALFPDELVSTANLKDIVGCPNPVPGGEFVCGLPAMIPAQAVPTSVAVGPDGAYYVSELKGFPGPTGASKIWRIEPGALHADCAVDSRCSVVVDGLTSIVGINFGADGTLYAVEMDEASAVAIEVGFQLGIFDAMRGGTVNACDIATGACTEVATGLSLPLAADEAKDGSLLVVTGGLLSPAEIITIP